MRINKYKFYSWTCFCFALFLCCFFGVYRPQMSLPFGMRVFLTVVSIVCVALFFAFRAGKSTFIIMLVISVFLTGLYVKIVVDDIQMRNKMSLSRAIKLHDIKQMKRAISEGYDVNAMENNGFTMLTQAYYLMFWQRGAEKQAQEEFKSGKLTLMMLKVLLENGADVNMLDEHSGNAPLHYAVGVASKKLGAANKIVELLISHGADVNLLNKKGYPPLYIAVDNIGDMDVTLEVVKTLIEHGADVNFISPNGKTALDLVIQRKYEELVELLRKYVAKTSKELSQEPEHAKP
jgi:ankyrin repeat protein